MISAIIAFFIKLFTQKPTPPKVLPSSPKVIPSIPVPVSPPSSFGYKAGVLAEKYETGNRGPGYISNGASWGDPGGDSYGSYQLETKLGTMQAYLKTEDKFTVALNESLPINSAAFRNTWTQLAAQDPDGFEQSQFNFLAQKSNGFYEALDYARGLGWNVDNLAMQSAIFSTSNQSGRWKTGIFDHAGILPTDSLVDQINKLYDARADYFQSLTLSTAIKVSIIKSRTVDERKDCLKLVTN